MKKILLATLILIVTESAFSQTFILEETFPSGLRSGSVSWGDINNDGNLDFIQTGNDVDAIATTRLYINTGASFELQNTNLPNLFEGFTDWGDYDNDGDLDLLLAGSGSDGIRTRLYDNVEGDFLLNENVSLHGVDRGSVEWGDYDEDGDLDILISGQDAESGSVSKIYKNENGTFTEIEAAIAGVSFGIASWVDFDSDGDLDVMVSGVTGTAPNNGPKVSQLYENNGTSFLLVFEDSFEGLSKSSVDFGDYDSDGDLDFIIAGLTNSNTAFTAIYQNNGASFDIVFDGSLPNVTEGQVLWGDSDNDGDLDAFISGNLLTGNEKTAQLYANTGSGFELESSFNEAGQSSASFGDYDSDGDLDIFISGQRNDFSIYSGIYKNENSNETRASNANIKPATPSNLTSQMLDEEIVFDWDLASDNNTPQNALSYEIYFRSESDTLLSSPSLSDGKRKLVKRGNSGSSNSFTFKLEGELDPGDYFWSVQSIDNAFEGSPFAEEATFHINFPPVITGTSSSLNTPEETSLLIEVQDIVVDDPDNDFPSDFTLTVLEGNNYTLANNEITPVQDFNGMLSVSVLINDGTDNSEIAEIDIEVTPVNDPPVISGASSSLSTPEESSLLIEVQDIIVNDPDSDFPSDFTLTVLEGNNYTRENNEITPVQDFNGMLSVSVLINDGTDNSEIAEIDIEVTPVNDPPVITGSAVTYSTPEETSIGIEVQDLIVDDPDNDFPSDFTLTILEGDNYAQSEEMVIPNDGFYGIINVPVTVNDGTDSSEPFNLTVEVTQVLGFAKGFIRDNFSVYPNPSTDYLIIQPTGTPNNLELAIYDLNGVMLFTEQIAGNKKKEVDLTNFKSGFYLLKISSESKIGTMIFLKE